MTFFSVFQACPAAASPEIQIQHFLFDQRLDHFNSNDLRTFKQRYQICWDFVDQNSTDSSPPILFLVGPERGIQDQELQYSVLPQYGAQLKAVIVAAEVRRP
jgi:16S rRNA U1498 N3-methylase RsmE